MLMIIGLDARTLHWNHNFYQPSFADLVATKTASFLFVSADATFIFSLEFTSSLCESDWLILNLVLAFLSLIHLLPVHQHWYQIVIGQKQYNGRIQCNDDTNWKYSSFYNHCHLHFVSDQILLSSLAWHQRLQLMHSPFKINVSKWGRHRDANEDYHRWFLWHQPCCTLWRQQWLMSRKIWLNIRIQLSLRLHNRGCNWCVLLSKLMLAPLFMASAYLT